MDPRDYWAQLIVGALPADRPPRLRRLWRDRMTTTTTTTTTVTEPAPTPELPALLAGIPARKDAADAAAREVAQIEGRLAVAQAQLDAARAHLEADLRLIMTLCHGE